MAVKGVAEWWMAGMNVYVTEMCCLLLLLQDIRPYSLYHCIRNVVVTTTVFLFPCRTGSIVPLKVVCLVVLRMWMVFVEEVEAEYLLVTSTILNKQMFRF